MPKEAACKACKDYIPPSQQVDLEGYCVDCFNEKKKGVLPHVTDPTLKPTGTGTVLRQQIGRGKTNG